MNPRDRTLYRGADGLWRSPLLDAETWLGHAFGTALARPDGEWRELRQVHSARVVECRHWREELEADALVTAEPAMPIAVKSADCLPILLADPVKRAVAAIHAGWRGCAAGIALRAVEQMGQVFGSRPEDLRAAFGPSIRACCFEVGSDVAQQFTPWFPEREDLNAAGTDGRTYIDLPEASLRQLMSAGLRVERVSTGAPCTMCGGGLAAREEFHSWRRDHSTGARMHSVIWVRP